MLQSNKLMRMSQASFALFPLIKRSHTDGSMSSHLKAFLRRLRDENKHRGGCLRDCVDSKWFELCCGMVILSNCVIIARQSDMMMANSTGNGIEKRSELIDIMDFVFDIFYAVELFLRIMAHTAAFIIGSNWAWNLFDSLLVGVAIYERTAGGEIARSRGEFLRILRLVKIVKLFRVIRIVRMFRELRLMLVSILGSMKSMFWAIIVIFVITFMFGACFLQALSLILEDAVKGEFDSKTLEDIKKYWGSVTKCMLSLYMASTGGISWIEIAEPLRVCSVALYFLFLVYVAFFMFVIANTLTSLLLEATIQNAARDNEAVMHEALTKKQYYIKQIEGLFRIIDTDGAGEVAFDQVTQHLEDPSMVAFMQSLDIDVTDVMQFFNILSTGGTATVNIDTFVSGCMKLRGQARSMDLVSLIFQQRRAWKEQRQFIDNLERRTSDLQEGLRLILVKLERPSGSNQSDVLQEFG